MLSSLLLLLFWRRRAFYWLDAENWAQSGKKQGGEQRISGWMGCFFAGRGLSDGGSVAVDFGDDALYSYYTPRLRFLTEKSL
jgi:hypothetical protein